MSLALYPLVRHGVGGATNREATDAVSPESPGGMAPEPRP